MAGKTGNPVPKDPPLVSNLSPGFLPGIYLFIGGELVSASSKITLSSGNNSESVLIKYPDFIETFFMPRNLRREHHKISCEKRG